MAGLNGFVVVRRFNGASIPVALFDSPEDALEHAEAIVDHIMLDSVFGPFSCIMEEEDPPAIVEFVLGETISARPMTEWRATAEANAQWKAEQQQTAECQC